VVEAALVGPGWALAWLAVRAYRAAVARANSTGGVLA